MTACLDETGQSSVHCACLGATARAGLSRQSDARGAPHGAEGAVLIADSLATVTPVPVTSTRSMPDPATLRAALYAGRSTPKTARPANSAAIRQPP
jgi:hypothetical protein